MEENSVSCDLPVNSVSRDLEGGYFGLTMYRSIALSKGGSKNRKDVVSHLLSLHCIKKLR